MDSFANIFQSHFKDHSQTPDEFGDYKLEFLNEHQKSYKQLGDILTTKEDKQSHEGSPKLSFADMSEEDQDLFDLQVEIKLRKYTSFENGFMENHRNVLKNSLQDYLNQNDIFNRPDQNFQILNIVDKDIKSYVFNEKLFTCEQIQQNKERLLTIVDEFRILKEILQSFDHSKRNAVKDAVLMGVWILKHTDHLVESIVHQNNFCIKQVQKIKEQLLEYLENNSQIDVLKLKIAQQAQIQAQFFIMVQSWLYTLLIAKLGYFDNDSFDLNVTLEQHLKALLKEQKRQHSVLSDSEDDQIMNIQCLRKKRKI